MKTSLGPKLMVYPVPVLVVGTYDIDGRPNVMTASWGGICCSQPPCLNVSLRKATYSYHNMLQRKAFTVSIPSAEYVRQADYFGIASGRDTDKFAAAGLTAQRSEVVDAPFVAEFPIVMECRLMQAIELGLHTQFIGEVLDTKLTPDALTPEGEVDIRKLNPLIYATGTREYYGSGEFVAKAFTAGHE